MMERELIQEEMNNKHSNAKVRDWKSCSIKWLQLNLNQTMQV